MAGEREEKENNRCPLCGGHLRPGRAIVPFLFSNVVILVKDVPAEICSSCHEPYTTGKVTDQIVGMLNPLRDLQAEVLILSYPELETASRFGVTVEA